MILRNIVVFHVFAIAALFSWTFGGTQSRVLEPALPWFAAILLCGMLFFPQHRSTESIVDARERVWNGLLRDPLAWVSLALIAIFAIPFVNRGLCPDCDAILIAGGASIEPPISWLPYCVEVHGHLQVFSWFSLGVLSALAVKHSMLKRGKRVLLEMLAWNAAALGVIGFVQQVTGAVGPLWLPIPGVGPQGPAYFFSVWGYPNMAGAFFTFFFAISVGLWQYRMQQMEAAPRAHEFDSIKPPKHMFLRAHYMLFAVGVNFFSAIDTLSRAAMMLVSSLAVLMFVHVFMGYFGKVTQLARLKMIAFGVVAMLLAIFSIAMFTPKPVAKEINTLNETAVLNRITGKGVYHVEVSAAILRDSPLFGAGGWGYRHLSGPYLEKLYPDPKKRPAIQVTGGANVHNDYLQFLCEHGVVGGGLILAVFVLLLIPIFRAWRRLYVYAIFAPNNKRPSKPFVLYCMATPVIGILLGCIAVGIHAFGDCPLRTPAVLVAMLMTLAAADGFLPREAS